MRGRRSWIRPMTDTVRPMTYIRIAPLPLVLLVAAACAPGEPPADAPDPVQAVEEGLREIPLAERVRAPFAVEVFGSVPPRERVAAAPQGTDGWVAVTPAPGVPTDDDLDEDDFEGDPEEREIADPEPGQGEDGMPVHEVRPGESFWAISRQYGVEMDELADANIDVDPGRLEPGTILRIPAADGARPEREGAAEEPEATRTHIVRSGDTLWNIARSYGVSEERIRELNDMPDSVVRIGQTLLIPESR